MEPEEIRRRWEEFLSPDVVRSKLQLAGVFLVAYEILRDTITGRPLNFFADHWSGPNLEPIVNEEYRLKVLKLDPKGKEDRVRGSLAFLRELGAISEEDEITFRTITDARNSVAHELHRVLHGERGVDFVAQLAPLSALVLKIERWWIINVELPTNPDFDQEQVDENSILPGRSWMLQVLADVALGEGEDPWKFYHAAKGAGPTRGA
jgi:hypothetical protein